MDYTKEMGTYLQSLGYEVLEYGYTRVATGDKERFVRLCKKLPSGRRFVLDMDVGGSAGLYTSVLKISMQMTMRQDRLSGKWRSMGMMLCFLISRNFCA